MTKEDRMERARQLHKSGLNCCQAVLLAFADKLPVDETAAKMVSAPFGRGLAGMREVCGCVSGMAMACGFSGKEQLTKSAIDDFRIINGDVVCARLLQKGKKPCNELIADAAGILSDYLE